MIKEFKTLQELNEFKRCNENNLKIIFFEQCKDTGNWFAFFDKIPRYVSKKEIRDIDDRITDCMIENPCDDSEEYYVKIWFSYKIYGIDNDRIQTDGRHEFLAGTKDELISEIKKFMKEKKETWEIVLN